MSGMPLQIGPYEIHLAVHAVTLIISLLMLSISIIAYYRDRRARLLFVALAFLFFALRSAVLFGDSLHMPDEGSILLVGWGTSLAHLFDLCMISLFFLANAISLRELDRKIAEGRGELA
jgi:hypothetical protein